MESQNPGSQESEAKESESNKLEFSRRDLLKYGITAGCVLAVGSEFLNATQAWGAPGPGNGGMGGMAGPPVVAGVGPEAFPTSPFIVNPFVDPLAIPQAMAPGWRQVDGTLAPADPAAWTVRRAAFLNNGGLPGVVVPGPAQSQQDVYGFIAAVPGVSVQHDGTHQVWPNNAGAAAGTTAGANSVTRLIGPEGGPLPDPILYHIRLQVAEHSFTTSRVRPIRKNGRPLTARQRANLGIVVDANGTTALPPSTITGFNGTFPGPMINGEYGKPTLVRFENDLDLNPQGLDLQDFGAPDRAFLTHQHNGHTAPESDGQPHYMQINDGGYIPGDWVDNLYLNYPAGGDPNEKQSFLWFHDHRMHNTGSNVYKGMVGLFPMYDPVLDPGDENDPGTAGTSLHLPGVKTTNADGSFNVKYDIPMALYDCALDDGVTPHADMHTLRADAGPKPQWWGKTFFKHYPNHGFVGDVFTVNCTAYPVLHVEPRKYRLRFLGASVARIYELCLMTSAAGPVARPGTQGQWQIPDGVLWRPWTQIASMGGLLPAPIVRNTVQVWPATRNEHVVDFSQATPGQVIYLTNILEMPNGRKPNFLKPLVLNDAAALAKLKKNKVPLVKIIVDLPLAGPDNSTVPAALRPMPVIPDLATLQADPNVPKAEFTLKRTGKFGIEESWVINNLPFDPLVPLHVVKRGQPEVWTNKNGGGGWVHPMHMHMEEHTVLERKKSTCEHPDDTGKSDVTNLDPGESVTFYRNFRTFTGRYVAHCHNLAHEDHNMMFGWSIEEP